MIIEGCPAKIELDTDFIYNEIKRRRPGQSSITTRRNEDDDFEILSGVFEGKTLGTPICIVVRNKDIRSDDYKQIKDIFRPSHADFTYYIKYGFRDWRGGGRASARETVARVMGGAVAKQVLKKIVPEMEILSWVQQVGKIKAKLHPDTVTNDEIESNIIRCPDKEAAAWMIESISEIQKKGDSIGGIISGIIRNVPPGLGEPCFSKLEAELAKAMLSIPASKGFEIGAGFGNVDKLGSELNDPFIIKANKEIGTKTNFSGGIQGGISNGENITFSVLFKPPATIRKKQQTINEKGEEVEFKGTGRHDPCILPRAVPIVDSMAALVLLDHYFLQKARSFEFNS
jgi:chorismate synthase